MAKPKKPVLGGQAIIEGVMIKSPNYVTMAARAKDDIKTNSIKTPAKKFSKIFFIRGIVNLIDMLVYGMKAIIWSGNQAEETEEKLSKGAIILTLLASFGFVILFFVLLPYFLTSLLGIKEAQKPIAFNLVDGFIRILFFVLYIYLISFMKDIRRMFQYHGAEHKAIHCYEAEKELKHENIKPFSTIHPRCGTSFIMIVFFISILVFSVVPSIVMIFVPSLFEMPVIKQKLILFITRLIFIPVVAGLSYEILRINVKSHDNLLMKIVNFPGYLLQMITTREPDEKQIEVAVVSLKKALENETAAENK